jgi:hypothetical protein
MTTETEASPPRLIRQQVLFSAWIEDVGLRTGSHDSDYEKYHFCDVMAT